jgi:uncharacterized protein YjaG (DUF416 family)
MKTKRFHRKRDKILRRASNKECLQFGLVLCKRMLPDYESFHGQTGFGDPSKLRESMEIVGKYIEEPDYEYLKLEDLVSELDACLPDTDDFSGIEVSYALNASASTQCLIAYLKDKNTKYISTISTLFLDTIDFQIQESDPSITEDEINKHPRMIEAIESQLKLLN